MLVVVAAFLGSEVVLALGGGCWCGLLGSEVVLTRFGAWFCQEKPWFHKASLASCQSYAGKLPFTRENCMQSGCLGFSKSWFCQEKANFKNDVVHQSLFWNAWICAFFLCAARNRSFCLIVTCMNLTKSHVKTWICENCLGSTPV